MVIVEIILVLLVLWAIVLLIRHPKEIVSNILKPWLIYIWSYVWFALAVLIFPLLVLIAILDSVFNLDLEKKYRLGSVYDALKKLFRRKEK